MFCFLEDTLLLHAVNIFSFLPDAEPCAVSRAVYTESGFSLLWPSDPNATCGYVVEWHEAICSRNCPVDWIKVAAGNTNVSVESGESSFVSIVFLQMQMVGCQMLNYTVKYIIISCFAIRQLPAGCEVQLFPVQLLHRETRAASVLAGIRAGAGYGKLILFRGSDDFRNSTLHLNC